MRFLRSRRAVLATGIAVVAMAASFGPARPVWAHATLEDTSPRASAVLEDAPTEIVLDFDEEVESRLAQVTLLDESGSVLKLDPPVTSSDASQVVVPVDDPADLGAGIYVVVYRVTSTDSHVVSGSFSFQIGTQQGDQQSVLDRLTNGRSSGDAKLSWTVGIFRFLAFLGLAVVLGGWAAVAMRAQPSVSRQVTSLLWAGVALAALGTLGAFLLQGPRILGTSYADAFDPSLWRDVARTRYGKALLARLVLLGLAVVPMLGLRLTGLGPWRMSATVVGLCTLVTFGASGHPDAGRWPSAGLALDVVHLGAVCLWLGGLVTLAAAGPSWVTDDEASRRSLGRFSTLAGACVAVVALTGVLQAFRIMSGSDALNGTTYGRTLVAKVTVVVLLVVLGAMARATLHRHGPSALRPTLAAEAVLGLVVLGITAGLVAVPPAAVTPVVPSVATVTQAGFRATLTVTPAQVGANDLHLSVSSPADVVEPTVSASVRLSLPERGITAQSVAMIGEGPDHYSAYGVPIAFAGEWQVDIVVAPTSSETVLLRTSVTIAGPGG